MRKHGGLIRKHGGLRLVDERGDGRGGGGGGLCLKEWMFQEAKQKLFRMKGPEITTNKNESQQWRVLRMEFRSLDY